MAQAGEIKDGLLIPEEFTDRVRGHRLLAENSGNRGNFHNMGPLSKKVVQLSGESKLLDAINQNI